MTTATLKNCVTSEKTHGGEKRLGPATIHHISGGVYEIIARCQHPEGGQCFRSYGLFDGVDAIPDWVWNAR